MNLSQKGKTVLIRKSARRKSPTRPPSRGSTTNSAANNSSQSVASPEPVDVSSVNFIAKAIRIGSVPASPVEPVFLSEDSISFYVECKFKYLTNSFNLRLFHKKKQHLELKNMCFSDLQRFVKNQKEKLKEILMN